MYAFSHLWQEKQWDEKKEKLNNFQKLLWHNHLTHWPNKKQGTGVALYHIISRARLRTERKETHYKISPKWENDWWWEKFQTII